MTSSGNEAKVSVISWNTFVLASSPLDSAVMTNARERSRRVDGSLFFRLNSSQSSSCLIKSSRSHSHRIPRERAALRSSLVVILLNPSK